MTAFILSLFLHAISFEFPWSWCLTSDKCLTNCFNILGQTLCFYRHTYLLWAANTGVVFSFPVYCCRCVHTLLYGWAPPCTPERVTSQKISKILKTCFEKNIFLLFSKEYFPTKHHWSNLTGFWQWASPCVRRLLEILSWWPSFLYPFFPWNCVLILMRDLKFRLYEVRMFGLKNHRGKMLFFISDILWYLSYN